MHSIQALHELALKAAEKYFKAESELIEILQKIDQKKVFRTLGYSSLFVYATKALKLPENTAYTFITVARKAVQFPELKAELKTGNLNISNARRIAPILNQANKTAWLEKAKALPQKKLEQEIAREFPGQVTQERLTYVTETRLNLVLGISDTLMKKLKRAQDLVSQSQHKPASIEAALEEAVDLFLKKKDPVEIAKQIEAKKQMRVTKQEANSKVNAREQIGGVESAKVETQFELTDTQVAQVSSPVKPAIASRAAETSVPHASESQKLVLRRVEPTNSLQNSSFMQTPHRQPVPASVRHKVFLRDNGQCTHQSLDHKRCTETRWVHLHHIKKVNNGGDNTLSNLTTLCFSHHKALHEMEARKGSPKANPKLK